MWNLKIQQTSESNQKRSRLTDMENLQQLPVERGKGERQKRGRGLRGTSQQYKIRYKARCSSYVQVNFYMERIVLTHQETIFLIRQLHVCHSSRYQYLSKGSFLCLESRSSVFMDLTPGTTTFLRYLTTHLTLLSYFWTSYTQSQCLSLLLQTQICKITVTFLFHREHRKKGERDPVTK